MNRAETDLVKATTKKVWGTNPAGWMHASAQRPGTKDFFDVVLAKRSTQECPWLSDIIMFSQYAGKKVLEIGSGAGYDAYHFCKHGAQYTGIDLVPENRALAKKHLGFYGYTPNIYEMDAERMHLPEKFDLIYSFGVLHHIPNIEAALARSFEHLKDDGKVLFIVYHKHSIAYWLGTYLNWIIRGRFFHESLAQSLGRVEQVGSSERPLVRVYTKKEFCELLKKAHFVPTVVNIRKLEREDLPLYGIMKRFYQYLPETWLDTLSKRWGWYLCVEAEKIRRVYHE